jgi:hypothetical protein
MPLRVSFLSVCLFGLVAACAEDAAPGEGADAAAASDMSPASGARDAAAGSGDAGADAARSQVEPVVDAGRAASDAATPPAAGAVRYRSDVEPVTRVEDAMPGTFIPPFETCRAPVDGEPAGMAADGEVCTHAMISACTEPGRWYPDYASCDVVRTQRPFWEAPPANVPREDDPRLGDAAFMTELSWATEQVAACGCTCCHDSRVKDGKVGQWDINRGPIWLDTLSDTGLALFVGLADSSALGAYPAKDNFGFDRDKTGIPTTDTARMQAFLKAEMARRGITEEQASAVPPFGGPIYQNRVMKPTACAGQGVDAQNLVQLAGSQARYVYVQEEGAENPGVPPNQDLPDGTVWRIDVLASAAPLAGTIAYGTTPDGSFQTQPAAESAPALERGKNYKLYVLRDVGLPVINCIFTFGEDLGAPAQPMGTDTDADAGAPTTPSEPGEMMGEACSADAFGAACTTDADCACAAAGYCALMPGQAEGYCTATGCIEDPAVCPSGWSCFDLSAFSSTLPAICMKP